MSLFDSFDSNSEELIQVNMQRSFQSAEDFPEVVIAAFKEETFHLLEKAYPTEQIGALREGRTIPIYRLHWRGQEIGIYHSLAGGAGTVCLLEQIFARGVKKVLLYGNLRRA